MATFSGKVNGNYNDAKQASTGAMTRVGSPLTVTATGAYFGFRIQNVTIYPGATINAAEFAFNVAYAANDDAHFDLHIQIGDAAEFTTTDDDISDRTITTAYVDVDANSVGTGWYTVTGLATAIQEAIDDPTWAYGNDIAVILLTTTGINLAILQYDGAAEYGAELDIDYTDASASKAMHHYRTRRNN